jgi:glycogen operon protein
LQRPFAGSIIYELHVGGFTRHANSGVEAAKRGTYAGLIEKIPYLQALGITIVELLPVQQFDPQDAPPGRTNYWGYSPIGFFAPHRDYSSRADPLGPVEEFRDMVKALHRAGIEVILDVVFNHTAEGNHTGPTLSFRGLENRAYYMLEFPDHTYYANYSGCGNTLNGNHSIVRRMIVDCLHYWVQAMHVDGFRFDLASVLSRDERGQPLADPPILWEIESDPVLAGTKIIAEAWDAAGLYQVGSFIGHRWAEWNGQYRDDVRRFLKGDAGTVGKLAMRLGGSRDLYPQRDREPNRSINFITCHDGFTLNDLVSYNAKHNQANGEDNRDGSETNWSWNCGAEGATDDPAIEALRVRQIKNALTILLISQGTSMLLMGDEVRRSQRGNNNAYCQDNELSWFDWDALHQHADLLRFVRGLIQLTQRYHLFREEQFWTEPGGPDIIWHGVVLNQPDWGEHSHSLAFEVYDREIPGEHLHVLLNAYWEPLTFELPARLPGEQWHRAVDTALPNPDDWLEAAVPLADQHHYTAQARSVVILVARWHTSKVDRQARASWYTDCGPAQCADELLSSSHAHAAQTRFQTAIPAAGTPRRSNWLDLIGPAATLETCENPQVSSVAVRQPRVAWHMGVIHRQVTIAICRCLRTRRAQAPGFHAAPVSVTFSNVRSRTSAGTRVPDTARLADGVHSWNTQLMFLFLFLLPPDLYIHREGPCVYSVPSFPCFQYSSVFTIRRKGRW